MSTTTGSTSSQASQPYVLDVANVHRVADFYHKLRKVYKNPVKVKEYKQHTFAPFYQDPDLQALADEMISIWVETESADAFQNDLRDQLASLVAQGFKPQNTLQQTLALLLGTREIRWGRLATKLRITTPTAFRAYRGVYGVEVVRDVVDAWKNGTAVRIPAKSLASWSFRRADANKFGKEADPNHAVLFDHDVPVIATLADILVDDSGFLEHYWDECEVVTVSVGDNAFVADPERVIVTFLGKDYRFSEKEGLIAAWDTRYPVV